MSDPSFLLTVEDLQSLTGYKRKDGQTGWLRERGWVFETDRKGAPVVSRAYAEWRLGLPVDKELRNPPRRVEPNFSALIERRKSKRAK